MKILGRLAIFGLPLYLISSCATNKPVVKSDKYRKKLELQSNTEKHTTMVKLEKNRALNKSIESIKDKKNLAIKDLLNLSNMYLAQKNLSMAEEYCRKALQMDLKNIEAKKILANIYFRNNNIDMANIILNGISDSIKNDTKMQNLLGLIALRENRNSDALAHFHKGLKSDPTDISIRMNLGVLYLYYRQINQASLQFERVLKLVPDHSDARLNMAVIDSMKGKVNIAEKAYEEILSKSENPIVLFNYALLEKKKKNYDKSLGFLKRYLSLKSVQSSNNEPVFALIDEIEGIKRANGDRTTDSEIKKLADKLKNSKNLVNTMEESQPGATKTGATQKPRTPKSDSELSEDDEISILEKELSGE